MPKITLLPINKVVTVKSNIPLYHGLKEQGVHLHSLCGGNGACGRCVIKIVAGEDFLNSPTENEKKILGNVFHITSERLACQCQVYGDISIDITAHLAVKGSWDELAASSQIKVRKKTEPEEQPAPPETAKEEKPSWFRHWENESKPQSKKLGGKKRPKYFKSED